MSVRLDTAGKRLDVVIDPLAGIGDASLALLRVAGGRSDVLSRVPIATPRPGQAIDERFALPALAPGITGFVAMLSADGGFTQTQFLAAEPHAGVVVTAGSLDALPDAVLNSDLSRHLINRGQFGHSLGQLHEVPRFNSSTIRVRRAASASGNATISGRITYHDLNNTQRPVRNVLVSITSDGGQSTITSARTDLTGQYSLSFAPAACAIGVGYQVDVVTEDGLGTIQAPGGNTYSELSVPITPCPGDNVTGVNLDIPGTNTANDAAKAFSLLDALYTVGRYYASVRQSGWVASLTVHYPDGTNSEYADRGSLSIFVDGGAALCGTSACPEEAFGWDELAHESGHLVAFQGGFDASPGGSHAVCDNQWIMPKSKSDAVHLAWSEGWATFYGLNALREEGVPNGIPGVQDGVYTDTDPNGINAFNYGLDDNGGNDTNATATTCTPAGEDSEMAVQRALWEFHDGDSDQFGGSFQLPMSSILASLEAAKPVTFTGAYDALMSGQGPGPVDDAQRTLTALGFAPAVNVSTGSPPKVSWTPGGPPAHPNTSFTVEFINTGNGVQISSDSTSATSYTPGALEWSLINSIASVSVVVSGSEGTSPQSGPFPSAQVPVATSPDVHAPRILIIGDSISNGLEGSYTWRYRLWQHFGNNNVAVQFVGHRTGTENIYDDPNNLALVNGTPSPGPAGYDQNPTDGSYRDDSFEASGQSNHDAVWGWQLHLAMNEVKNEVAAFQPNYLLVELGFNDLAFGISSPSGAIGDMGTLIANARSANPRLKIVIGNIVHRTELPAYPYINPDITSFNNSLPGAIASWTTLQSPVREADISSGYDPSADTYDGLHPNGIGEYVIAAGFEAALHNFGLGPAADPVPSSVPDLTMTAPPWITATAENQGLLVQWGHTYGASGYNLYSEDVTAGATSFTRLPLPIPGDHWTDRWVLAGHTYAYYVTAIRGSSAESPPSPTGQAAANPGTLIGPQDISDFPGASSIDLTWSPVSGDNGSYQILWSDQSLGSPNIGTATISATSYSITGLIAGHVYAVAVAAINQYGGGYPGGAMPALVGAGAPAPTPEMKSARQIDSTDALLEWTHATNETGVWIYQSEDSGVSFSKLPFAVTPALDLTDGYDEWTAGLLFQPISTYAYYVIACNGSDCTNPSSPITIAPLSGAAPAGIQPVLRNQVATMLDPSRHYYQEGLGQYRPGPEPVP